MARNRNRQAGPIRRSVTAAATEQPVSRNLLARTLTDVAPSLPIRKRTYTRVGGPNDWGRTSHLPPTSTAMTAAWSYTASERRA
jgi:hypothetical protein